MLHALELLNNYLRDLNAVYTTQQQCVSVASSQVKYVRLNSCIYISNLNDFNHNDFAMNLFVITYNEGNNANNILMYEPVSWAVAWCDPNNIFAVTTSQLWNQQTQHHTIFTKLHLM